MSNWNIKKEEEIIQRLKNTLESESLQFIGKFASVEEKDFGFFKDVRSISGVRKYYPTNEGEPDDFNNRPLEVWSKKTILFNNGKKKLILEDGKWYIFFAVPTQSQLRLKNRNPFLLQTDLTRAVDIRIFLGNELIENIQKDSINTPEAVKGKLTRSIEALSNEINTQPATFIFELIQNADDYPNDENYVKMSFDIKNPYLVIKHNGSKFDVNNAVAICDINEGDKRGQVEKIGFKGIGFKSIFKDCNLAYLKSGEYSFRFDEVKWRNEGRKLFWQITPINTDENEFSEILYPYNNVNLVIKPKELKQLSYYKLSLQEHFKDERILLFLRNVKEIDFNLNEDSFSISNSSNKWRILKSKNILVDEKIREELNRGIALNDKRIPIKYQNIEKTEIGFGFFINENKVQNLVDASIYAYLPTKVNLGFGFLLNGNFIPDGSRTHLHQDLTWNDFLFEKAGEIYLNKLVDLIENGIEKSSVINLIPNFDKLTDINDDEKIQFIKAFKKGFDKNIETVQFIPTNLGSLEALSNIIIDETGFIELFGSDFFQFSMVEKKLVNKNLGEGIYKLKTLIKEYEVGVIYDFEKLKSDLKSKFQGWLKKIENNSSLILLLDNNKQLEKFCDEAFFLAKDGNLCKYSELYFNLGEDHNELIWLNFKKLLHPNVSAILNEISLPFKQYDPISFINKIICGEKKLEIIEGLKNGSISFVDFYSYLSKYVTNPLFPAKEIMSFPVKTSKVILPSWSSTIYFNTNSLSKLSTENSLPDGLFHIIDDNWSSKSNLKLLGEKLGVKIYSDTEPFSFIQTIIAYNNSLINRFYLSQTSISIHSNASLWSFILSAYKNLSDPQKENISTLIKKIPILSKNGEFKALSSLYLSSEYTDNDALENLSYQFSNSNIDFVNADYLKEPSIDKTELKTLFKKLDVKTDTKDFLQHTLIPNLHQISDDLLVPLARLIYENRDSETIINAVIRNSNFKLKTKEGTFKTIKECYVGSPYIEESKIPNPIISVPVVNQISADYSITQLDAWQRFFSEKLKVKELINEVEIISLKLKYIADYVEQWQNDDVSVLLLRDVYNLYKSDKLVLSSTNLSYIKKIPLLCIGHDKSKFHTPNAIHFSSAYKPTFDFEKIFGLDCGVPFLSELYKFDDTTELILFFENIGVTQYYDQYRHSVICQNMLSADGQKKPASQLFNYKFIKYVGQSNVAFEDLSKFKHNGKTLEEFIGFKAELDVEIILNYITDNEPEKKELKYLINQLLDVLDNNNYNDLNHINTYKVSGKLLSTNKSYNLVRNLDSVDDSIKSGIRENEYLIDPLFSKQEQEKREKYFNHFGIKTLGIHHFNPHFEGSQNDHEFSNRVKERLVFLAYDSDDEKYLEIENDFKEKFKDWKINKCTKISLKYPADESKIIKEDNRNFILPDEKTIYYLGQWEEQRNYVLVQWLKDYILKINKQLHFIQDILLNNPLDIISDFENKGRVVPNEIKERFKKTQVIYIEAITSVDTQTETTNDSAEVKETIEDSFENPFKDINSDDEMFIRSIIKGDFELNEKLDVNTTAKIKTLLAIKGFYNSSEIKDQGRFLSAGNDEIIVRSAQKGILYLDVYHWGRLVESNVSLSIYTKNKIYIYKTQEELIEYTKSLNKFGILRMPDDYDVDDYNSLENITDKGKWHYVFIVNENTEIAKNYNEVMNLDDYNF